MSPGDRVTHDRLGLGRVVRIVDHHDVVVNFGREDGAHHSVNHMSLTVLGEGEDESTDESTSEDADES